MGGRPSAPAEETPAAPTVDLLEPSGSQHFHTWGLGTGTSQVHATRCALSRQICLRGTVHAGHQDAASGAPSTPVTGTRPREDLLREMRTGWLFSDPRARAQDGAPCCRTRRGVHTRE